MKNFDALNLSALLAQSLEDMDYSKPTPIQAKAIPLALQGHDIMGSAQTGTGKTAAFSIPLIEFLLENPEAGALVMTPTREIGKQIMDFMHQLLGRKSDIKTAFIIGGEPMGKQLAQLKKQPRLIVGTPGRINDHLDRGTLKLGKTHFLVLDETDRMLDMGFTIQLEEIFKYLPEQRQTLMFSATLPPNILKMSKKYMNDPQRIAVGEVNRVATNIRQEVIRVEQSDKYEELTTQLHEREGSVVVFVKTKHGADKMAVKLRRDGFTADALHGDLQQRKRDKVMVNFRKQNFRILIATDIAARGLDVPHIEHVINYDLPQVAEDFIHRIGRTARAGAEGEAVSFVSRQEGRKWHAIEVLLNPELKHEAGSVDVRGKGGRRGSGRKGGFNKGRGAGKPEFKGKRKLGGAKDAPKAAGKRAPKADGRKSDGNKADFKKSDFKKSDFKKDVSKKSAPYKGDKPKRKSDDRPASKSESKAPAKGKPRGDKKKFEGGGDAPKRFNKGKKPASGAPNKGRGKPFAAKGGQNPRSAKPKNKSA